MTNDADTSAAERSRPPAHSAPPRRGLLPPVAIVTVLAALFGYMYLGYTSAPEQHLHDFPLALVNQDVGDTFDGTPTNIGDSITEGIVDAVPADQIDLRLLGINEAQLQLRSGEIYGAIVIPSDFTKRLAILGAAAVVPGDVERPIITVLVNQRAGAFAAQITNMIADRALTQVNTTVGTQLTDLVREKSRPAPGAPPTEISGASRLLLDQPIEMVFTDYRPLPDGAGHGLSAFFYTLVLLLAGFIGAVIIHTMTDAHYGYAPAEYGPWYLHRSPLPMSRWRILLVKWGLAALTAPLASGALLGAALLLDMPVDRPLPIFLYGTLAVLAVAVTALAVLAAFGTAGLVLNMIVFVVLGLPSSSGTVPVEATPRFIADLATFEPMHQIYLAVRSLLYFDGNLESGMAHGFWMTVLGLAIGVTLGAIATHTYDLRGFHRLGVPHKRAPASEAGSRE
ncbi:YhgE/Pip domain-containing protein [Nocardia otitidiscaviarum]|uniref:YhgE/Pip domain-containing protein n=1 Tax=Nocardia otitidiscaviarum TaxID=1823 RepID=UPI002456692E|nr:ABC transporter permease [Nocardia otitidiscaviarum]